MKSPVIERIPKKVSFKCTYDDTGYLANQTGFQSEPLLSVGL